MLRTVDVRLCVSVDVALCDARVTACVAVGVYVVCIGADVRACDDVDDA